jgi:hypothetical protein
VLSESTKEYWQNPLLYHPAQQQQIDLAEICEDDFVTLLDAIYFHYEQDMENDCFCKSMIFEISP